MAELIAPKRRSRVKGERRPATIPSLTDLPPRTEVDGNLANHLLHALVARHRQLQQTVGQLSSLPDLGPRLKRIVRLTGDALDPLVEAIAELRRELA